MMIPEVEIYKAILAAMKVVNGDWETYSADNTKTILYDMFGLDSNGDELKLNHFKYFEQAQKILLKSEVDRRLLNINIGYNLKREGMPTIHILLPSETFGDMGVGSNEGYLEGRKYTEEVEGSDVEYYMPRLTHGTQVTYNLFITSSNYLEVVILYHFLKYVSLSMANHFENVGFQNTRFGGSDLSLTSDLLPKAIFHRNFNMSFTYDWSALDFTSPKLLASIEDIIPSRKINC